MKRFLYLLTAAALSWPAAANAQTATLDGPTDGIIKVYWEGVQTIKFTPEARSEDVLAVLQPQGVENKNRGLDIADDNNPDAECCIFNNVTPNYLYVNLKKVGTLYSDDYKLFIGEGFVSFDGGSTTNQAVWLDFKVSENSNTVKAESITPLYTDAINPVKGITGFQISWGDKTLAPNEDLQLKVTDPAGESKWYTGTIEGDVLNVQFDSPLATGGGYTVTIPEEILTADDVPNAEEDLTLKVVPYLTFNEVENGKITFTFASSVSMSPTFAITRKFTISGGDLAKAIEFAYRTNFTWTAGSLTGTLDLSKMGLTYGQTYTITMPAIYNVKIGSEYAYNTNYTYEFTYPYPEKAYVLGAFNDYTPSEEFVINNLDEEKPAILGGILNIPEGEYDFYIQYDGVNYMPAGDGVIPKEITLNVAYQEAQGDSFTHFTCADWPGGTLDLTINIEKKTADFYPSPVSATPTNSAYDVTFADDLITFTWRDVDDCWTTKSTGAYITDGDTQIPLENRKKISGTNDYIGQLEADGGIMTIHLEDLNLANGDYTLVIPEGYLDVVWDDWDTWGTNPDINYSFTYGKSDAQTADYIFYSYLGMQAAVGGTLKPYEQWNTAGSKDRAYPINGLELSSLDVTLTFTTGSASSSPEFYWTKSTDKFNTNVFRGNVMTFVVPEGYKLDAIEINGVDASSNIGNITLGENQKGEISTEGNTATWSAPEDENVASVALASTAQVKISSINVTYTKLPEIIIPETLYIYNGSEYIEMEGTDGAFSASIVVIPASGKVSFSIEEDGSGVIYGGVSANETITTGEEVEVVISDNPFTIASSIYDVTIEFDEDGTAVAIFTASILINDDSFSSPADIETQILESVEDNTITAKTGTDKVILDVDVPEDGKLYYRVGDTGEFKEATDGQIELEVGSGKVTFYVEIDGVDSAEVTYNYTVTEEATLGINAIQTENNVEYFNLQGVKVKNPDKGIYLKVVNGKTVKVII